MVRSLHQQRSQIRIAFLADVHLRLTLAGVPPSWLQPQIAAHVATFAKAMRVFQCQQERQRDQRPHSFYLLQPRHLRIAALCQLLDPLVALADLFTQRLDSRQQRLQCRLQLRTQPCGFFRIHIAHVAPAQPFPIGFGQSRAVLTSAVRARTNPARARITVRSACAFALRCFTGHSNCGSIRANRASVCASRRSSFFRLSPINRTLRACATITSCPNSLNKRLTQGECVPVSSAIRLRGIPPTLPSSPSESCSLVAPIARSHLHPARNTNSIDLPDRNRSSASVRKNSCSASLPRC